MKTHARQSEAGHCTTNNCMLSMLTGRKLTSSLQYLGKGKITSPSALQHFTTELRPKESMTCSLIYELQMSLPFRSYSSHSSAVYHTNYCACCHSFYELSTAEAPLSFKQTKVTLLLKKSTLNPSG